MSHLKQVAMCPLETSLVASDEGGDSKSSSMASPNDCGSETCCSDWKRDERPSASNRGRETCFGK